MYASTYAHLLHHSYGLSVEQERVKSSGEILDLGFNILVGHANYCGHMPASQLEKRCVYLTKL